MTAFLTSAETAALLKISPRTLRRLASAGRPPHPIRVGARGVRYSTTEIAAFATAPAEIAISR